MSHLQEHSSTPTSPRMKPNHPSNRHSSVASASAAAALGWSRHKPLPSKPPTTASSISPSAARAASLATRSPSPRRQDGQRRRAPSTGGLPSTLRGGPPQSLGNSAAAQAFRARPAGGAQAGRGEDKSQSLLAARGAVSAARPRSMSSPTLKQPAPEEAALNGALNGAGTGIGNGNATKDGSATQRWEPEPERKSADDGAVLASTISPLMYTANPPVALEVEERKKEEELHASAVAMAKSMFNAQSKLTEDFLHEDDDHQQRSASPAAAAPVDQPSNLHEAAYKLAQERLAKLSDEHQKNRGFRDHYAPAPAAPPRRRFTVGARLRRRSSSDADAEARRKDRLSNRASVVTTGGLEAKAAEREKDRAKVLAAAQRNVRAQLEGMDQSVKDKGRMEPPKTKGAWASRAQAIAQAKSSAAAAPGGPHEGERDVGGGRYVAQDDIDAVARENLKPLLQEIDERAEKERERQRELKEEAEAKRVEAAKKEAYDKEVKDNLRKLKAEQKAKEKERAKVLKEEERARKKEEKARRKAEKEEQSRDAAAVGAGDTRAGAASPDSAATDQESPPQAAQDNDDTAPAPPPRTSDAEPKEQSQHPGKVKSWLRAKLTRQKPRDDADQQQQQQQQQPRGFVGGHGLRSPETTGSGAGGGISSLASRIRHPHLEEERARTPSLSGRGGEGEGRESEAGRQEGEGETSEAGRQEGEGEASEAGRQEGEGEASEARGQEGEGEASEAGRQEGERPEAGRRVSSLTDDMYVDARDGLSPPMTPPRLVGGVASGSPNRDSRFVEMMD